MKPPPFIFQQYPQIRFRDDRRWLWNPVKKQVLKNRPEERVRLETIEFLHRRGDIPYSRMTTELPVKPAKSTNKMRTDILVYGRDMQPYLLVECKSRDVKLTPATALQAAQYNSKINAEYILLTNGLKSVLFKSKDGKTQEVYKDMLIQRKEPQRDTDYWTDRGFCAHHSPDYVPGLIHNLYTKDRPVSYFDVPPLHNQPDFSHYYTLFESGNQQGWAVATMAGSSNETWAASLKFDEGTATAALSVCFNTLNVYFTTFRPPMKTMIHNGFKKFIEDELLVKNTSFQQCMIHLYEKISSEAG